MKTFARRGALVSKIELPSPYPLSRGEETFAASPGSELNEASSSCDLTLRRLEPLLTEEQARARLLILGAISLGAFALRAIDPVSLSWMPWLRPSCGAVTGLPCIFCGTTRAFHQLLNGHFAQALYFNWLVFPLAVVGAGLFVRAGAEVILRRRLPLGLPSFRLTPRLAAIGLATLMALWLVQISLAIGLHKDELLNPNGMHYALLVR